MDMLQNVFQGYCSFLWNPKNFQQLLPVRLSSYHQMDTYSTVCVFDVLILGPVSLSVHCNVEEGKQNILHWKQQLHH